MKPVAVVRDGEPAFLELRVTSAQTDSPADCTMVLENGEELHWTSDLAFLPALRSAVIEGVTYIVKGLYLPPGLPYGYHRLRINLRNRSCETLLIVAPRQAYTPNAEQNRLWGVFIPLYSLHSEKSWGAGNLTDLENLIRWVKAAGGNFVGTLPLLPTFLNEPFDPSPYAPVSRLFWNEFYLDITKIPELPRCPEALDLLGSPEFQKELTSLRTSPLVDHRRGAALRRTVLEALARCFFSGDSQRQAALSWWSREHPSVQDYARFRAATDRRHEGWPLWPERMREGALSEGDYDPEAERYHLYVQWLTCEQFRALSTQARQNGPGLYLDFPLGAHSAGYDVWRERAVFAMEASTGAPPDALFEQGQDWGFRPLHPERIREQGYRYYIACLRHHLRHAGILRLDHVMGLHHLFWIPPGFSAREGLYVRYHADEFYAILSLESHRHRAVIIGEDLGTVPPYIRTEMARYRLQRMYVLPFEIAEPPRVLRAVPAEAAASLNTHDMPPFASFWASVEENTRAALSAFLHKEGWLKTPSAGAESAVRACLAYLAASNARIILVNLEDLWQETAPQNVPGTGPDFPNWRRKARYPLELFTRMPKVLETLQAINSLRKRGAAGG